MNGAVRLLDAISLQDEVAEPFRYARDAITHVEFSHDSKYLATAVSLHFAFVSYKRKYVYEVLVNCLFKLAQEKVWLGELTVPSSP